MRFLFPFLALLMACSSSQVVAPAVVAPVPMPTPTNSAAIAYLALGDSYTIGEGAQPADRWPMQLASLARQQGLTLTEPDIIARTGWTTADLQGAIRDANNQKTYGLVSLLIGVNNQYQGKPVAQYRTEFRALLATAIHFAGGRAGHVVVLSIPDWGQSPYAAGRDRVRIGTEIDQFNAVAHEECQHADVAFVDITPLTRSAAGDATQFAPDGLHYTSSQMRRWAEQALPVVQTLLR